MPEIHFTDALLTAIVGGGIGVACFLTNKIWKIETSLIALKVRLDLLLARNERNSYGMGDD